MTPSLTDRIEARLRAVPWKPDPGCNQIHPKPVWDCCYGTPDYPAMARAVAEEVEGGIAGLKTWIGDLQSGLYINCVYCGFRYGPGESMPATLPDAGETLAATALREHVEKCPDHPMSHLKARTLAAEARVKELAADRDTWHDDFQSAIRSLDSERERVRVLRKALESIMNYADDPPCSASLDGSCDKGYHNEHGRAILQARAALAALPGQPGEEER